MRSSDIAQIVEEFFAKHSAAGLVLPNGWFGRPYDNLHRLTACTAARHAVRVELDGQLTLTFEGAGIEAVRDRDSLTVRGFTKLVWEWLSYGPPEGHREVFADGDVAFVAPVG